MIKKFIHTTINEYLNENIIKKIIGDITTALLTNITKSKLGMDYYFVVYNHENKKIGYIEITDRENGYKPLPYYQSGNVELNTTNRGYGSSLYISLINNLDKPIISDPGLSEQGKKLWNSLLKRGYAKIWIDNKKRERYISINKLK